MKSAPFATSPIFLSIMFVSAVLGGLIGWILANIGQSGWFVGALCGFLPMFVAGPLRVAMARAFANTKGISSDPPMAFNFPIRIAVAAVTSLIASYAMIVAAGLSLGSGSGILIGAITGAVMAFVMTIRVIMSD